MTSGVCSSVERSLLASTQQRQSPGNQPLFGLSNFAADGVKLFAKVLTSFSAGYSAYALFVLPIVLTSVIAMDTCFGTSGISSTSIGVLTSFLILGIMEIATLSVFSTVQSTYVSIALIRLTEMTILVEVTWSFVLTIAIASDVRWSSASSLSSTGTTSVSFHLSLLLFFLFVFLLLSTEKVPFDIVEAESELIDGVTTEFDGYAFSLVYAGELVLSLVLFKFFSAFVGLIVVFPIVLVVLSSFVGRVFLARFLMADIVELCLSIGL